MRGLPVETMRTLKRALDPHGIFEM